MSQSMTNQLPTPPATARQNYPNSGSLFLDKTQEGYEGRVDIDGAMYRVTASRRNDNKGTPYWFLEGAHTASADQTFRAWLYLNDKYVPGSKLPSYRGNLRLQPGDVAKRMSAWDRTSQKTNTHYLSLSIQEPYSPAAATPNQQ